MAVVNKLRLSFLPYAMIVPLLIVAVLSTYWFIVLSNSASRQIDTLATANSDSLQWSLAQTEVDLLVLITTLQQEKLQEYADLKEIRLRFDVFYSRIRVLRTAPVFLSLRTAQEDRLALEEVDVVLRDMVKLVDGPDHVLHSSIESLTDCALALRPVLRKISLSGVKLFATESDRQRDKVVAALTDLAVFAMMLFVSLVMLLGALIYLLAVSAKQTEQVRLEQERIRSVMCASLDGIIVADIEGRVVEINAAASKVLGIEKSEALGRDTPALIFPNYMQEDYRREVRRFWDTGESLFVNKGLVQTVAISKQRQIFPIELSVASARSGHLSTLVYYIRDISSRLAIERELVTARDRALEGERAKAEVLAVMSHEMRTPLNGIVGSLELLSGSDLTAQQKRLLDVMRTSGQMLLDRVNTVLEISRLDLGRMELVLSRFDPIALVNGVVETFSCQASSRKDTLKVNLIGPAIMPCLGDQSRLEQVLINLIGNAIKFTENGTITVEVESLPGTDDIEFRVIDTGAGIPKKDLDRIFEDFVTLDISYGRKVEGTGLGLAITRRLVKAMKGTLGVESQLGSGSVFWFRLPLPRAPFPEMTPDSQTSPAVAPAKIDLSILLVEDNEINRLIAREMLITFGCRVTEAQDGREGVTLAEERRFDAILMDISMPLLDGIRATEYIRKGTGPNKRTPIIALTAHALPDDFNRFRSAGMVDVLVKPLTRERLHAVLTRACKNPEEDGVGPIVSGSSSADEVLAVLGEERGKSVLQAARAELGREILSLLNTAGMSDPAVVAEGAHRLLGLASVIGLDELATLLRKAERAARRGDLAAAMASLSRSAQMLTSPAPIQPDNKPGKISALG